MLAFAWFVVGFWAKEMVVVCCDATNRQKRKVKTRIPFLKPPSSFGKYADGLSFFLLLHNTLIHFIPLSPTLFPEQCCFFAA